MKVKSKVKAGSASNVGFVIYQTNTPFSTLE